MQSLLRISPGENNYKLRQMLSSNNKQSRLLTSSVIIRVTYSSDDIVISRTQSVFMSHALEGTNSVVLI